MFGAIGSTPYNIMLLIHILGAIVAFGAAFVNPLVQRMAAREGSGSIVASGQAAALARISFPALLVTGLIGFGIAGMSDQIFKLSQTWLMLAVLLWLAQAGLYFFGLLPAFRRLASGETGAASAISGLTGVGHILLLAILYLMIWKPGL